VRDDHNNPRLPSPWKQIRLPGLRQNDFRLVTGPIMFDHTRNPDFSANASPIIFGFARWNTHMLPTRTTRQSDIDNWTVSIYSVASPPSGGTISRTAAVSH
jgi:hypothetical protein